MIKPFVMYDSVPNLIEPTTLTVDLEKLINNIKTIITIIIFHTGNILIMGTKNPLLLLNAYNFIIQFINININIIRCDSKISTRKKISFDYGHYIELK